MLETDLISDYGTNKVNLPYWLHHLAILSEDLHHRSTLNAKAPKNPEIHGCLDISLKLDESG